MLSKRFADAAFEFRGKSGKDHRVSVRDRRLARVVRTLEELPGRQLFKYRDAEGHLCPVTSDDVNAYIRAAMGDQFSAKDFRTWGGTLLAAEYLAEAGVADTEKQPRQTLVDCVKYFAADLGNTPAVIVETANPAKFPVEVQKVVGWEPDVPTNMLASLKLPEDYDRMGADYDKFRDYLIARHATP